MQVNSNSPKENPGAKREGLSETAKLVLDTLRNFVINQPGFAELRDLANKIFANPGKYTADSAEAKQLFEGLDKIHAQATIAASSGDPKGRAVIDNYQNNMKAGLTAALKVETPTV